MDHWSNLDHCKPTGSKDPWIAIHFYLHHNFSDDNMHAWTTIKQFQSHSWIHKLPRNKRTTKGTSKILSRFEEKHNCIELLLRKLSGDRISEGKGDFVTCSFQEMVCFSVTFALYSEWLWSFCVLLNQTSGIVSMAQALCWLLIA